MNTSISDFIIHIEESLTPEQMSSLADAIREHACVVSAGSASRTPHMMMVAYDPDCGHSHEILSHVHRQGFHASSIGL
ncbi:MAG: hypothetical protein ABL868_00975 [Sulfuriferula sp.]